MTWVLDEVPGSDEFNTHIRDNLLETGPAKITTLGDLLVGSGANALKRFGVGNAGEVLTVNGAGDDVVWDAVLNALAVHKTADETVGSSSTLQDDDHLVLPVEASTTYIFAAELFTEISSGTGAGIHVAFAVPSGATVVGGTVALDLTGPVIDVDLPADPFDYRSGNQDFDHVRCTGYLIVDTTAGNFQLQFAQDTGGTGSARIKKGSTMYLVKV